MEEFFKPLDKTVLKHLQNMFATKYILRIIYYTSDF